MVLAFAVSCKNDNKNSQAEIDAMIEQNKATPTDPANLTVPNACEMITKEALQAILNVTAGGVNIKESNDPTTDKTKSCFFQWDDPSTPNAGILIQIQTNPVYEEYPQYISQFVTSKLNEGETVLGAGVPTKFKRFSSAGSLGAYSFDQSRFYWNLGNDYLFMLAFNLTSLNEEKMVKAAEQIVAEVNKNFASKTKK